MVDSDQLLRARGVERVPWKRVSSAYELTDMNLIELDSTRVELSTEKNCGL